MNNAQTHGVGVIGLGTVGLRYIEQFQNHASYQLVAGFDVSDAASAAAVDRFGIAIAESAEALVADPNVDVIYIAVPPLWHEEYVDLVIAHDKAMLCEKPLGVDDAQSAGMVERVQASGVNAAVNYVFGAAPSAQAMSKRVAEQRDTVHSADLKVHFETWPRAWQAGATWLRDRDQGGWVREVVSHYVFLVVRLFGEPEIVSSVVDFPADGTSEQRITAVLRCGAGTSNEVDIHIVGSSDAAGGDEVEFTVRGADQSWRLTNWYEFKTAAPGGPWELGISAEDASGPVAYAAQLGQLSDLIQGQPNTLATFAEALQVQQIVEALLERGS